VIEAQNAERKVAASATLALMKRQYIVSVVTAVSTAIIAPGILTAGYQYFSLK